MTVVVCYALGRGSTSELLLVQVHDIARQQGITEVSTDVYTFLSRALTSHLHTFLQRCVLMSRQRRDTSKRCCVQITGAVPVWTSCLGGSASQHHQPSKLCIWSSWLLAAQM